MSCNSNENNLTQDFIDFAMTSEHDFIYEIIFKSECPISELKLEKTFLSSKGFDISKIDLDKVILIVKSFPYRFSLIKH